MTNETKMLATMILEIVETANKWVSRPERSTVRLVDEYIELNKTQPETAKSWMLNIADLEENTFDLSVKNPNKPEEEPLREPVLILEEMTVLDEETNEILGTLNELI